MISIRTCYDSRIVRYVPVTVAAVIQYSMKYAWPIMLLFPAVGCAPRAAEQAELDALKQRINNLEWKVKVDDIALKRVFDKVDLHQSALLAVGDPGYSIARNEFGVFLFILDDVQPYLDGHKVLLRIGNLTAGTLTGVSLEITHGRRYPEKPKDEPNQAEVEKEKAWQEYSESMDATRKLQRKLVVPIKNDLSAASWTRVEAAITPCKPDELGYVEIRLSNTGIKLPNTN